MNTRWTLRAGLAALLTVIALPGGVQTSAARMEWRSPRPVESPYPRPDAALAYAGGDHAILFGGAPYCNSIDCPAPRMTDTWVYDASADSWAATRPSGHLWVPECPSFSGMSMAYIANDKVLLTFANSWEAEEDVGVTTWVYDLADNEWSDVTPSSPTAPSRPGPVAYLGDDKALLYNGDTWVYDLGDELWTQRTPHSRPPADGRIAYIGDDHVLFYDGNAWMYDLSDDDWRLAGPFSMGGPSEVWGMDYIGEDKVLLYGGDTWVFDLSDGWTLMVGSGDMGGTPPPAGGSFALAYIGGDQVVAVVASGTWVYDLDEDHWSKAQVSQPWPRSGWHALARIDGSRLLLFGGEGRWPNATRGTPNWLGDAWVYDVQRNLWIGAATGPGGRSRLALADAGEGRVLLFGGTSYPPCMYEFSTFEDTWLYDANSDTWTDRSPPAGPTRRCSAAMAFAGGDKVVLFGGYGPPAHGWGTIQFDDTWVYDLSDNAWTQQEPALSPTARDGAAIAQITDGEVLLFGGSSMADTWVYDLAADKWTEQHPVAHPSAGSWAMAGTSDGHALLATSDGTWLYDLATRTWTPATEPGSPWGPAGTMAAVGSDAAVLYEPGLRCYDSWPCYGQDTWVWQQWPVTVVAADCNADGVVNAGDVSAVVLEIFDGDGEMAVDAPGGTFPGDPAGCDANADESIDAGDVSRTIMTIFGSPAPCGGS